MPRALVKSNADSLVNLSSRYGRSIQTFSGKRFYPLDPKAEDVDIVDIAHSLSNQCRFSGHSMRFYSVAQHSVLVSQMCGAEDALWGLLHDSDESYLIDLPSPLKRCEEFNTFVGAQKKLMLCVCECFGLGVEEPLSVRTADKRMLATEARDLMLNGGRDWDITERPYDFHIEPWSPEVARAKFFSRFHELTRQRLKGPGIK